MSHIQQFIREGFLDQPRSEKIKIVVLYSILIPILIVAVFAATKVS